MSEQKHLCFRFFLGGISWEAGTDNQRLLGGKFEPYKADLPDPEEDFDFDQVEVELVALCPLPIFWWHVGRLHECGDAYLTRGDKDDLLAVLYTEVVDWHE